MVDECLLRLGNAGSLRVNDSHLGCPRLLPTHGGSGLTGGVWGEANYPMLRTSRLQAISVAVDPAESPAATRARIWP